MWTCAMHEQTYTIKIIWSCEPPTIPTPTHPHIHTRKVLTPIMLGWESSCSSLISLSAVRSTPAWQHGGEDASHTAISNCVHISLFFQLVTIITANCSSNVIAWSSGTVEAILTLPKMLRRRTRTVRDVCYPGLMHACTCACANMSVSMRPSMFCICQCTLYRESLVMCMPQSQACC